MIVYAVAVPPAVGVGGFAVASLGALIAFIVAWGLAHGWGATFGYFFQKLGNWTIHASVRGVGFAVTPFHKLVDVDHYVRRQLDQFQAMSEHAMVYTFGKMIELSQWTAITVERLASDTWHGLTHRVQTVTHTITERIVHTVVKPITRTVTATAGISRATYNTLAHRVSALQAQVRHIAATLPHDIALAPARVGITAKQLRRLSRRLTRVEELTVGLGAVALVGAALGRLGLGWLRCPALGRIGKKIGCGGFSWLEGFFAEAFEALLVIDLCRFALAAQSLARFVVPQLGAVLLVENAVCLGGGASLPSAHDVTHVNTKITPPSALLDSEA